MPVISSGSKTLMQVTTPPTGWTKDTSFNDYALRVVTGAASSGGTVNFSTALASLSTTASFNLPANAGATTLTAPQLPQHSHQLNQAPPLTGATRGSTIPALTDAFNPYNNPPNPTNNPPINSNTITTVGGPPASGPPSAPTTQGHTHGVGLSGVPASKDFGVRYVDCIIATRN